MRRVCCVGFAALILALGLTGCWDRVEIEDRGFVVGAGIDLADEEEAQNGQFILTYQFVIPGGLQAREGDSKNGSSSKAYFNLSTNANTMFAAARKMSYQTSRSPYLQHMRMILISRKLSESGELASVLDLFLRDHEMRRATKIMVTEGDAREVLATNPKNEKLPVMFFESTSLNPTKSSSIYPPTNIGEVQAYILSKSSFALPIIRKLGNEVSVSGTALFDNAQKLKGLLNEEETSGLNILRGTAQDGVLEIHVNDEYMAYEIKGLRQSIQADVSDPEHIRFTIHLELEGNVGETQERLDLLSAHQLAELEEKTEQEVIRITNGTLTKLQQEFRVDVLDLGDELNRRHHALWQSIKDDWEQGERYFSRCDIEVKVRAKIRIVGSTLETK
ncbi:MULTISPECIES: Ger(x)C family spore germination protein [Paenibacillus]|uniref:Ger(x)C family spore germination protein n=1 Tax=Paenibacillus TaxID=44249 RepID=UPI000FD8C748|nr:MULTISPECIES: Ger(x)C family spore germination protein [Paenibacillus]MDU0328996.1 Ger(x)C family spore germination protein [Paenibacillus sp. 3LSP]